MPGAARAHRFSGSVVLACDAPGTGWYQRSGSTIVVLFAHLLAREPSIVAAFRWRCAGCIYEGLPVSNGITAPVVGSISLLCGERVECSTIQMHPALCISLFLMFLMSRMLYQKVSRVKQPASGVVHSAYLAGCSN